MNAESLVRVLADGRCHSGEDLAARFGVSRTAVWKTVAKLGKWGLDVAAVPGVGYRLDRPLDLIDVDALRAALPAAAARKIGRLDVFTDVDSTNRYLLDGARPVPGTLAVCVAEHQHAGRGRRGRRWQTPLGAGLALSVGWQFDETPPDLAALALAIGVVTRRVLVRMTRAAIGLKWPNDLVYDERKLGGILVELVAEAHGGCWVVAGVGINVAMPPALLAALSDWPRGAADLAEVAGGAPPHRAAVVAALLAELAELFAGYAKTGFGPYRAEFAAADWLLAREVSIETTTGCRTGIARGIDADGALLVEMQGCGIERVISGDVSVRAAP